MANTEEEKKRRAQEEANLLEREENIRTGQVLAAAQPPKPKIQLELKNINDSDRKKLYAKYKKDILKNEEADDEEVLNKDGCLVFTSEKEAESFFNELALENVRFLATWKGTDSHYFSCRTGKMYQGSFQEIHSQLENAIKNETDPDSTAKLKDGLEFISSRMNASVRMKESLKETKEEPDEPEQTASTAPNPFETSPKPKIY